MKLKLTVESSLSIAHSVNRDTAAKDQQEDRNGKRKAVVIGFDEVTTSGNVGIQASRKKLSLALPPQSQKKDLCGEELTTGVSAACKENKKPNSNGKKLFLGLKQSCNDTRRKLSLRPIGELSEVSKTEVLAQTDLELEMNQNEDTRSCRGEFENSGLEETSMPESIVVLDSEDSGEEEEETVSLRSKLSLARGRRGFKCRP